jgi:hypothetical protein
MMKLLSRWTIVFLACLFLASSAFSQPIESKPGLERYTPTRIEWLALVLNSIIREEYTSNRLYGLTVVAGDHETILIFVRYSPNVNREIMNKSIDSAREVAQTIAKKYGWESWVKIRENIEMFKQKN